MHFYYTYYFTFFIFIFSQRNYFNIITFKSCIVGLTDVLHRLYYTLSCHPSGVKQWPFQHSTWPTEWITGLTPEEKARATLNCVFQYMLVIKSTLIPTQLISKKASSCLICFLKQHLFLGIERNVRYFGSPAHF